jgi:hypothetical protein
VTDSEKLDRILAILEAQPRATTAAPQRAAVADDADLDGPYGNPIVKRDPTSWAKKNPGKTIAPCVMSDGPADWLDAVASFYDWQADQDAANGKTYTDKKTGEEKPSGGLQRRDAARARGWAARVRAGKVKQGDEDASVPF